MLKHLAPALIALSMAALPQTISAEPRQFGNKVTLGKVANLPLTREQKRIFRWYSSKKSYFGAFYVVKGTDDVFWTRNFHSLNTAKAAAKQGCVIVHKSSACTLYAVVFPVGIDPNGRGASGLSQPASKNFQRVYPNKQKKGTYGAFAINGANGWGISHGWANKREAEAAALQFCKSAGERDLAKLPIAGRTWVRRKGLHKCRVVDSRGPAG